MSADRSTSSNGHQPARFDGAGVMVLAVLLVLPILAVSRLLPQVDWVVRLAVPLAISVVAFFTYWSDKRAAEAGRGRVPESTLHLLALCGGWPGAFLAQRIFRHKTAKFSFQAVFWLLVGLYQYVALDYLLHWRLSHAAWRFVRTQIF